MLSKIQKEIDVACEQVALPENIFNISQGWRGGFEVDTSIYPTILYKGPLSDYINKSDFDRAKTSDGRLLFDADKQKMVRRILDNINQKLLDIIDNYGETKNNRVSVLYRWYSDNIYHLMQRDVECQNDMYDVFLYAIKVHESKKSSVYPGIAQALKLLKTKYEDRV